MDDENVLFKLYDVFFEFLIYVNILLLVVILMFVVLLVLDIKIELLLIFNVCIVDFGIFVNG